MVVLLTDDEAENVASLLRRMHTGIANAKHTTPVYVDDRGPEDFANQLEALVDADNPTAFVPFEQYGSHTTTTARHGFATEADARTYADKVNDAASFDVVTAIEDVTLHGPKDDVADRLPDALPDQ